MKKNLIKKLDVIFSKKVRERDTKCLRCGKQTNLQCAHIISRREKRFRWSLDNGITLCSGCHLIFWHMPKTPDQNLDFLKETLPSFYEAYLRNKETLKNVGLQKFKPDFETILSKLSK